MRLILLFGPPAAGKLTIGRLVAERTGIALFHNHLIVDAVGAIFPFGSEEFVRLREKFWLETISAAACAERSLIFTFSPEPTVAADFPERLALAVTKHGGDLLPIALTLAPGEQERRLNNPSREAFGKLRSIVLLRSLQASFATCMAAMPTPALSIDTTETAPDEAAGLIVRAIADRDDAANHAVAPPADR